MSDNLTLGAGKIYFDAFLPGTETPTGERYIGNTPGFTMSVSQEKMEHFGSDSAVKEKDASKVISTTRSANIRTDEIDADNLALVFLGTKATVTTTLTTVADENVLSVSPGRYYQLGVSTTNPSGVRGLTDTSTGVHIVVTDDQVTPATFDVTDDYTVDMALGRIYIVPGGAITDGTNLKVDYKIAAGSREQIISGNDAVEGALRYIADNPSGTNRDLYAAKVSMTPNGDIDFKSANWMEIGLSVEVLKKTGVEALYIDGRAVAA